MGSKISVIIPTYYREEILLNTIRLLFEQEFKASEIMVVDQTPVQPLMIENQLKNWDKEGLIRWIKYSPPSVTKAMNYGALRAVSDILLFLDDDIIPAVDLIKNHLVAYNENKYIWAVVGRIIQPWQNDDLQVEKITSYKDRKKRKDFDFNSTQRTFIDEAMAGNLSIIKKKFVEIGGFDENFGCYRFEKEFAERVVQRGGRVLYEPSAIIRHLKAKKGGTRAFGDFNATFLPIHSVGRYYYLFRSRKVRYALFVGIKELIMSVYAKFYIYKPWWIPVRLMVELCGFFLAIKRMFKGPEFIKIREGQGVC